MFTGLVETVGTVRSVRRRSGASRIEIDTDLPLGEMEDGESVAVSGACLTVVERRGGAFFADAIPETLSRTTLGRLRSGSRVNLERALEVGDRLGGHLVQGHVDATARVLDVRRAGGEWRVVVERGPDVARYVAYKGSVAIDGVSLTVASVGPNRFDVALIPETLERTTLGSLRRGSVVNLEVDLLARYLETLMEGRQGPFPAFDETIEGSR